MYKANAIIRKVGDEYCVFSHDGKNLGCSKTRPGAEKRLKQVEYFKHVKGSEDMNDYKDFFSNLAKAVSNDDFNLTQLGNTPEGQPRKVDVHSETLNLAERLAVGTLAGRPSSKLLDKKDHFPVLTETQARSSMARVMQLHEIPAWYSGTIIDLRQEVYAGIMHFHPDIKLDVRVPAEQAVALSDGMEPSSTSIKDPYDERKTKKDNVPQVARPTLTSADLVEACKDDSVRLAVAGKLMEILDQQVEQINSARNIGQRLLQAGLTSEEFDKLSTYLQQEVLIELMGSGATASASQAEDRRRELLDRMGSRDNNA